jgi:hypothetical protein
MMAGLYAVLRAERGFPTVWRIIAGVCIGLSVLTREAGLILLLALLGWYLLVHRPFRKAILNWGIVAVIAILTVAPWTIRNYTQFNAFVPVSTNGGINFYIGNNPEATGRFDWRIPPGAQWDVASPNGEFELQASKLGYREGLRFIADNPLRFLSLTVKRIFSLYSPPLSNISLDAPKTELLFRLAWAGLYIPLLLFALVSLRYVTGPKGRMWALVYFILLSQSLPYFITFVGTRYQLPIIPLMALVAAYGVCRIFVKKQCGEG